MKATVSGEVRNIAVRPLGSALAADALAGATELLVEDVADFSEDGGSLRLGDVLYSYTGVDHDTDTIILADPLTATAGAEDFAEAFDELAGTAAVEVIAQVALDDDPDGSDFILATLTHALVPFLPEGDRESGRGEGVTLEQQDGEWVVTNVLGRTASFNGSIVYVDSSHVMTPIGGAAISPMPLPGGLTITAGTEVIKVVWSGTAAEQIPIDFGRLAIHVSKFPGYTPTQGTEVATVSSPYGGSALYAADGGDTYYVRCAIASLRGDYGDFTEEVAVTPGVAADPDTFEGDIIGGSISIATVAAGGDVDETFTGSSWPAGWAATTYQNDLALPDPVVTSTGVPAGSDNGSAILFDFGPATGTTSLDATRGYVQSPAAQAADAEMLVRFRHSATPGPDAAESLRITLRDAGGDSLWLDLARTDGRLVEWAGGSQVLALVAPVGGIVGGVWYWARLKAVGGRVEAAIWEDGTPEPEPTLALVDNVVAPGDMLLRWEVAPLLMPPAGLDTYVDSVTITRYATGFSVLPDGTARMTRAEIDAMPTKLQAGKVPVTVAAAGTRYTQAVTFDEPFLEVPEVATTPYVSMTETAHATPTAITTTGFTLNYHRTIAADMTVGWIAVAP